MACVAWNESSLQRYQFSKTKTKAMVVNAKSSLKAIQDTNKLFMNKNQIQYSEEEVHLSVVRTPDNKATLTVKHRIDSATGAAYVLLGAGFHGLTGLHLKDNYTIRLLYAENIL